MFSNAICNFLNIDRNKKTGALNEKEIKDAKWFNFNELSKINNKIPKEGVDYVNRLLKEN